ncbi:ATP-binding protein [Sphingobacterium sp. LRF_L2]|uniref:ATP-binding protein n=1 Tax=Sphingobacterium sp. LRF_L2 TaxID=3369421 RepID=UPI003F63BB3D
MEKTIPSKYLEHSPVAVCLVSLPNLTITYKNQKFIEFLKITGLNLELSSFTTFLQLVAPNDIARSLQAILTGSSFEIKNLPVSVEDNYAIAGFNVSITIPSCSPHSRDSLAIWVECERLPLPDMSKKGSNNPKTYSSHFKPTTFVNSFLNELKDVHPARSVTKEQLQAQFANCLYSVSKTDLEYISELSTAISNLPIGVAILSSREMVLQMANKYMLTLWDKDERAIGQRLIDYLPEMRYQAFPKILDEVYLKKTTYHSTDAPVELIRDGSKELVYMDFSYTAILDENDETTYILVMAENVTARTLGKMRQQQLLDDYNKANENLRLANQEIKSSQKAISTLNAELTAVNEEQHATNTKLHHSQTRLSKTIEELKASTVRFEQLVREASIGILVFQRTDRRVTVVNAELAQIFLTTPNKLSNQNLESELPELYRKINPFLNDLADLNSKKELYNEYLSFEVEGVKQSRYLNLVVQKHYSTDTENSDILVLCHDVTNEVKDRLKIQQAEAIASLSIETANMGIYRIAVDSMEMSCSERFKEIYGFPLEIELSYNQTIKQILPEHRERVRQKIVECITQREKYVIEYPIQRFNDHEVRWIKAYSGLFKTDIEHTAVFSGVIIDITEQKQDDQRKNDFIAMVSHELKTPLTSISAYLQLLRKNAERNSELTCVDMSQKAIAQVHKMTKMINGFLNVSRLESGKIHMEHSEFEIDSLLDDLTQELQSILLTHKIELSITEAKTVYADKDKIAQVVNNLITNAAKYSKSGTKIGINCKCDDTDIIISVSDEGMGISKNDLSNIFKRYYRVNDNTERNISGFGIGLYLCYEIVTRHQGKIWAESKLGKGSKFSFSIPLLKRELIKKT